MLQVTFPALKLKADDLRTLEEGRSQTAGGVYQGLNIALSVEVSFLRGKHSAQHLGAHLWLPPSLSGRTSVATFLTVCYAIFAKPLCSNPHSLIGLMPKNNQTKATLFVTCIIDQLYPQVGVSVVKVLRRLGVDVDFPMDQTCCGQPRVQCGVYRSGQ